MDKNSDGDIATAVAWLNGSDFEVDVVHRLGNFGDRRRLAMKVHRMLKDELYGMFKAKYEEEYKTVTVVYGDPKYVLIVGEGDSKINAVFDALINAHKKFR